KSRKKEWRPLAKNETRNSGIGSVNKIHWALRSDFLAAHPFAVDGSQVLHLGMPEDHHEDDRFPFLNPDPLPELGRHGKRKRSKTHEARAQPQRVDHHLQMARVETAVHFVARAAHNQ